MNSDISKRTSDFSLPNMNCASVRTTSVLPTPVGPRKRNEPMGRFGFFRPARERRMARAKAVIALSCEITRLCNSSSMRSSFCDSSSLIKVIGTPVQSDTTSSMSSRPTRGFIEVVFFAKGAQVLALFAFLVRVEARLLELVVRDGVFHAVYDELDPLLDLRDLLRQ